VTPAYDELAHEFTNIHLLVLLLESLDQRLGKSVDEGLSERADEGASESVSVSDIQWLCL
jgi:hypothetical protein